MKGVESAIWGVHIFSTSLGCPLANRVPMTKMKPILGTVAQQRTGMTPWFLGFGVCHGKMHMDIKTHGFTRGIMKCTDANITAAYKYG